jgi:hypothetical protein
LDFVWAQRRTPSASFLAIAPVMLRRTVSQCARAASFSTITCNSAIANPFFVSHWLLYPVIRHHPPKRLLTMAASASSSTPAQPDPATATSINDFVVQTVDGETQTAPQPPELQSTSHTHESSFGVAAELAPLYLARHFTRLFYCCRRNQDCQGCIWWCKGCLDC